MEAFGFHPPFPSSLHLKKVTNASQEKYAENVWTCCPNKQAWEMMKEKQQPHNDYL